MAQCKRCRVEFETCFTREYCTDRCESMAQAKEIADLKAQVVHLQGCKRKNESDILIEAHENDTLKAQVEALREAALEYLSGNQPLGSTRLMDLAKAKGGEKIHE